jgi:hypothetical protein
MFRGIPLGVDLTFLAERVAPKDSASGGTVNAAHVLARNVDNVDWESSRKEMIWETCARDSSVSVSGVTAGFCELGSDYLGCPEQRMSSSAYRSATVKFVTISNSLSTRMCHRLLDIRFPALV